MSDSSGIAVLATLISEWPSELPENISSLLARAPDSFDDRSQGLIAEAIREVAAKGFDVCAFSVKKHLDNRGQKTEAALVDQITSPERPQSIPIGLAEIEAETLFKEYTAREAAKVLSDGQKELVDHPQHGAAILENVIRGIEFLRPEPKKKLKARAIWELETPPPVDDPNELIRDRFLCRGAGMELVGPSGVGKSSLAMQQALSFAVGVPSFGLRPSRCLRSLLIQAENDDGDLAEMRDGVLAGLRLTESQRKTATGNVFTITIDDKPGKSFLGILDELVGDVKPDLVWLDPLFSYIEGSVGRQEDVTPFLRTGINPIIHRHKCGIVICHHTNKPPSTAKDKPTYAAGDFAYAGSGSVEIANWARAVVVLRSIGSHDVYELRLGKRGSRAGWRDRDGNLCYARHIAHSRDAGKIYWRDADDDEIPSAGRPKTATPEQLVSLIIGEVPATEWLRIAREELGISPATFYRLKDKALDMKIIQQSKINRKFSKAA